MHKQGLKYDIDNIINNFFLLLSLLLQVKPVTKSKLGGARLLNKNSRAVERLIFLIALIARLIILIAR